jgi:chaperonin GroEL
VCICKPNGFGDRRKLILGDFAAATGANFVPGNGIAGVVLGDLGRARRVCAGRDATLVMGGGGGEAAVEQRLAMIERDLSASGSEYDREKLKERSASLKDRVALIHLDGRASGIDDALAVVASLADDGFIADVGSAYRRAGALIDTGDVGAGIVGKALTAAGSGPLKPESGTAKGARIALQNAAFLSWMLLTEPALLDQMIRRRRME